MLHEAGSIRAFSNDSGCSGAALSRENTGETVKDIVGNFPYWFCKNYYKYADNEDALPFDQHFLIAANKPHKVYVASAQEDSWACQKNDIWLASQQANTTKSTQEKDLFILTASLMQVIVFMMET